MLDLHAIYEVITFSIGDTKAGSKMGKLQVKNIENGTVLNCILWEETLNRLDSKLFRTNNQIRINAGTYNEKYNNCEIRYGDMKKQLAEDINAFCAPIRERILDIAANEEYMAKVARAGAEKARQSAAKTLREVREIIGFRN